jgi:hypothetical protein
VTGERKFKVKSKLVEPIKEVVTGRFLVSQSWSRNWPFIIYLSFLALIMIASSHSAERKVHSISRLRTEMKELNSKHIDLRSQLMIESMEYKVVERAHDMGLINSDEPPVIIKATGED